MRHLEFQDQYGMWWTNQVVWIHVLLALPTRCYERNRGPIRARGLASSCCRSEVPIAQALSRRVRAEAYIVRAWSSLGAESAARERNPTAMRLIRAEIFTWRLELLANLLLEVQSPCNIPGNSRWEVCSVENLMRWRRKVVQEFSLPSSHVVTFSRSFFACGEGSSWKSFCWDKGFITWLLLWKKFF